MKKTNLKLRTIIIVVITLLGVYKVFMPPMTGPKARFPKKVDLTWAGIKQNLQDNINLGLDLKGGSHLVMRVKTDQFLKSLTEGNALAIANASKEAGFPTKEVKPETTGNFKITLVAEDPTKLTEIQDAVKKKVDLNEWSASTSGNTVTWTLTPTYQRTLSEQATEQAQRIIESRLNAVGVAEPLVQRHGAQTSHQILVQMPGIQDPERVKQLLSAESRLDLVHVVSPPSPSPVQTFNTEEEAKASLGGTVPTNRRVMAYSERNEPTTAGQTSTDEQKQKKWVVVEAPSVVGGDELRNAAATQGSTLR